MVTQAEGPAVPSAPPSNRLNLHDLKAQAEAGSLLSYVMFSFSASSKLHDKQWYGLHF